MPTEVPLLWSRLSFTGWRAATLSGVLLALCASDGLADEPVRKLAESSKADCTNGIDDDGDGLIDAADPECADEICDNGIDDDGDGWVDGRDSECRDGAGRPPREICDNGVDDDGDGRIDSQDLDCLSAGGEICGNYYDDDGDGLTDLADPDCTALLVTEDCANGVDDDGNGLVDYEDPNCSAPLVFEQCANGIDDDSDGLIDVADPDCGGEDCRNGWDDDADGLADPSDPDCIPENCVNGVDDDGDGAADIADPECQRPELCANGVDDDGDGHIDGADPHCPTPENCWNGIDDDFDGAVDTADTECAFALGYEDCWNGIDDDGDGWVDDLDPDCGGGHDARGEFGEAPDGWDWLAFMFGIPIELVVPDTWVEFGDDGFAIDFAWPIVVTWARVGDPWSAVNLYFRSLVEFHVETDQGAIRGVFGGSVDFVVPIDYDVGIQLSGEGGWVAGDDGSAAFAGGTLGISLEGWTSIDLAYRTTFVDDTRHAVTLQVEIPLPLYLLWQDN